MYYKVSSILSLTVLLLGGLAVNASEMPNRGIDKSVVRAEHGQPQNIEGPIGEPPITRWYYDDFTVVFEYDSVLHSFRRQYDIESRPTSSIPNRPQIGDTLNLTE